MKKDSCTVRLSLRKIELFDLLHRHLLPGPQLECLRPLVQQHIAVSYTHLTLPTIA